MAETNLPDHERKPDNETERVEAVRELALLDTPREEKYDRWIRRVTEVMKTPIAYVALIDANRQWLKSVEGDMPIETVRAESFCTHTVLKNAPLVIADTLADARFVNNAMVTGPPHLRFYAGIPLHAVGGETIGTLCVADSEPRVLKPEELDFLKTIAKTIEEKINAQPRVFVSYCHDDEKWKDRLLTHLAVLEKQNVLDVWVDRRIDPGDEWHSEIHEAIEDAKVAILLITAKFLGSDFIMEKELPRLLERREREGLKIVPIIVKPCSWKNVDCVARLQLFPKNGTPLASQENEVDALLADLADQIAKEIPPRRARPSDAEDKLALKEAPSVKVTPAMSAAPAPSTAPSVPVAPVAPLPRLAEQSALPTVDPADLAEFRLTISRRGASGTEPTPVEQRFRQARVVIGRGEGDDVYLTDPDRIVSSCHAEIFALDGHYWLRDLDSVNGTALNGVPLDGSHIRELHSDDRIEIGKFEIAYTIEESTQDLDRTLYGPMGINPFDEDVDELGRVLRLIAERYEEFEGARRADPALRQSLKRVLGESRPRNAWRILSRFLD